MRVPSGASPITNRTASPRVLMTRPPCAVTMSVQRVSKFSTSAPSVESSSSLDSEVNRDRSAKPTVMTVDSSSSSAAPERLDAGRGGGEVAPPGVDHELLEPRRRVGGQLDRGAEPALGLAALDVVLDLVDEGRDLPVGEPGHRRAERAGHAEDGLLVEHARLDGSGHGRHRRDVGIAVRDRLAGVGEAQGAPQPLAVLQAQTALVGDLGAGEGQLAAQDQARELVAELRPTHHSPACRASRTRGWSRCGGTPRCAGCP